MASELLGSRTQHKLSELSAALLQKRAHLRQSVDLLDSDMRMVGRGQGDQDAPGGDRADAVSLAGQPVDQGIMWLERRLLRETEAALRRLAMGTYGFCERCHRSIPDERLEALPWTPYCGQCARAGIRSTAYK